MGEEGRKILLVDDEVDLLHLLSARLESKGFSVVTASDGKGALRAVREEHPDLVVLDVMMPAPNGYQVCRTLKDDPELSKIPVLLLTAKSTESDRFWGAESGCDAYLTKPYNAEDLIEKIRSLLGETS